MSNIMLDFYGFKSIPFSKELPVASTFQSSAFQNAMGMLEFGVEKEDLLLLTGEVGSGKSVVLRSFLHKIDPQRFTPVYVRGPSLSSGELYKSILSGLCIEPPYTKTQAKFQYFKKIPESNKKPIVIIDDAQEMMDSAFLELKSLINFELDSKNFITIILTGQPELLFRIKMDHIRALAQRVRMAVSMKPLSCEETMRYIDHHLKFSGNKTEIFSENAKAEVFKLSQGNPRAINSICHNSLLNGAVYKKAVLDSLDVCKPVFL